MRDDLLRIAAEDFGGTTASDTIRRLIDEHWATQAVAAMDAFRASDPQGWADYVGSADAADRSLAPSLADDPWDEAA
ncbi:hypothetical protein J2S43_003775 [Catenuloplanes nepalensis]|uniref:Antitoxin n=1 Tax=Catenuloplanes nepalensis TaxID=587533 RepID=A0ABT9MUY5_9ACTN|nr:hypothetical protein [Catenuloplanes nepalensis]MDP9795263.1 hypothetical protein [Catenuloplanes nepalensis]